MKLTSPIELPIEDIVPHQSMFNHPSDLHGQLHVSRVMVHAFLLCALTGNEELSVPLWAAVYVHDLERNHDGICYEHGRRAADRIERDESLLQHLNKGGLGEADYASVQCAAKHHSLSGELSTDDPDWTLTALLKDADGLDRVRLGDLDPSYFRFETTSSLVPFAQSLFERSNNILAPGPKLFSELWQIAQEI